MCGGVTQKTGKTCLKVSHSNSFGDCSNDSLRSRSSLTFLFLLINWGAMGFALSSQKFPQLRRNGALLLWDLLWDLQPRVMGYEELLFREMPFSDSDLRAHKAGPKRMVVGAGNSLFVVVESVGKCGGKSFVFTPTWKVWQTGRCRIGVYDRGAGKWTLKRQQGRNGRPSGPGAETQGAIQGDEEGCRPRTLKTLQDAIDGFLDSKRSLRFTLTNYRRQLENQVTEVITATTPLRELEWDNGGRRKSEHSAPISRTEVVTTSHFGCRRSGTSTGLRDFEVDATQSEPSNQAEGEESKHDPKHHPHINGNRCQNCWRQSPEPLLRARSVGHGTEVPAHDLPEGRSTCATGWKWIGRKDNLLVIPGTTPGLMQPRRQKTSRIIPSPRR